VGFEFPFSFPTSSIHSRDGVFSWQQTDGIIMVFIKSRHRPCGDKCCHQAWLSHQRDGLYDVFDRGFVCVDGQRFLPFLCNATSITGVVATFNVTASTSATFLSSSIESKFVTGLQQAFCCLRFGLRHLACPLSRSSISAATLCSNSKGLAIFAFRRKLYSRGSVRFKLGQCHAPFLG